MPRRIWKDMKTGKIKSIEEDYTIEDIVKLLKKIAKALKINVDVNEEIHYD